MLHNVTVTRKNLKSKQSPRYKIVVPQSHVIYAEQMSWRHKYSQDSERGLLNFVGKRMWEGKRFVFLIWILRMGLVILIHLDHYYLCCIYSGGHWGFRLQRDETVYSASRTRTGPTAFGSLAGAAAAVFYLALFSRLQNVAHCLNVIVTTQSFSRCGILFTEESR